MLFKLAIQAEIRNKNKFIDNFLKETEDQVDCVFRIDLRQLEADQMTG